MTAFSLNREDTLTCITRKKPLSFNGKRENQNLMKSCKNKYIRCCLLKIAVASWSNHGGKTWSNVVRYVFRYGCAILQTADCHVYCRIGFCGLGVVKYNL